MKAKEVNIKNIIQKIISNNFFHVDGSFYINYDCIITKNQLVYPLDFYHLVDSKEGDSILRTVKFYHAFQKGYNLTIVVLDMDTGELLHRKHRINKDNSSCSWFLIQPNLIPKVDLDNAKEILNYCRCK